MRTRERLIASAQLFLIFPALLFIGSLIMRSLAPLQDGAHAAQLIVTWYAERTWTLWVFLIALPIGVLVTGCITFAQDWSRDAGLLQSAKQAPAMIRANGEMVVIAVLTLTAGAIIAFVVLHMLAN